MRRTTIAVVTLCLALAGCGPKAPSTEAPAEPTTNPPGPTAGPPPLNPPAAVTPPQTDAPPPPAVLTDATPPEGRPSQPPTPADPPAATPVVELGPPPGAVAAAQPPVPAVAPPLPMPVAPAPQPAAQPVPPKPLPPVDPAQPPAGQPPKVPDTEGPSKPKWPSEVAGRPLDAYLKELGDPDPALRKNALDALPQFGPAAQKPATPHLMRMMEFDPDPHVRVAAITTAGVLGFADDKDTTEAARKLGQIVDLSAPSSLTRLSAIQAIAMFGAKAEPALNKLTAAPAADPSYAVRQATAEALVSAGMNDRTGPYPLALACLANKLLDDRSVVVRLAAVRTMIVLGPPWAKPRPPAADPTKEPPPPEVNVAQAATYFAPLKRRLLPAKGPANPANQTGLVEPNKQVEIWVRVAVLRFDTKIDPKELEDTLNGVTKYLTDPELGPKLQALNALAMLGEVGARRLDDVVKVLVTDADRTVVNLAITTLAAMGQQAKPALPDLEKTSKKYSDLRDERYQKVLAEAKLKPETLKPEEVRMIVAQLPEEQTRLLCEEAIKMIKGPPKAPAGKAEPKTP